MNKLLIIYRKNTHNIHNTQNIDTIYIEPEPYYDFSKIKDKIEKYDIIIFLDDTIDYNESKITELIEYLILHKLDQLILHNSDFISSVIMEYDYYKNIIKSNKIFTHLTKEDIKQKNQPNNYVPIKYTLQPSIIRTKNFILNDFFLKKNPHI